MKTLLSLALLSLSLFSYGNAFGTHGMVMVQTQQGLVASHLPLHNSMHAHQLLLLVETQAPGIDTLMAHYPLITLHPEQFDLHKLMHGNLTHFKADVVAGHFERGGQTKLNDIEFTVTKQLLNKPISEGDNGQFYPVPLGQQTLLVHRIATLPSFDQLLLIDRPMSAEPLVPLGQGTPITGYQQLDGLPLHSLYLETQDFQARQ